MFRGSTAKDTARTWGKWGVRDGQGRQVDGDLETNRAQR